MASCLQTLTNCSLSSRANRKKTNCLLSNQKLCHLKHVLMVRYNFYFEGEQIQNFLGLLCTGLVVFIIFLESCPRTISTVCHSKCKWIYSALQVTGWCRWCWAARWWKLLTACTNPAFTARNGWSSQKTAQNRLLWSSKHLMSWNISPGSS